jgi:hypothetical protein
MTYDLSGVDVFFLSKELKRLENAKVDKIVQRSTSFLLDFLWKRKDKCKNFGA